MHNIYIYVPLEKCYFIVCFDITSRCSECVARYCRFWILGKSKYRSCKTPCCISNMALSCVIHHICKMCRSVPLGVLGTKWAFGPWGRGKDSQDAAGFSHTQHPDQVSQPMRSTGKRMTSLWPTVPRLNDG